VPFFAHSGVLSSLPTVRGALIGPPAETLSRARSAKARLFAAPTEPRGKFTVSLLAEQLPSGAGQHHHTLVVIIGDATKADAGRSGKFPCRTSLQPGWLTIRERGKTPLSSDRPHAVLSVRSVSALSLRSALHDDARQSQQELLWFYQVGHR